MIRHNLFYKLFALGIALVMWTYVNAERNPRSRGVYHVAVETRDVARGYSSELVPEKKATITLAGSKDVIDSVGEGDISAWVDVKAVQAGKNVAEQTCRIKARVSGVARNALDVTIVPASVNVRIEAMAWKQLPVEVKFVSAPPPGYDWGEPALTPQKVGVSGKITAVSRTAKLVLVLATKSSGPTLDDYFRIVPVDAVGKVVSGVLPDVDRVRLKMRCVEAPARKTVLVTPSVTGSPKFPARVTKVSAVPSSITIEGKPADLARVSAIATSELSIEGAENTTTQAVALRVPFGVRAVGPDTVQVTVYISAPAKIGP